MRKTEWRKCEINRTKNNYCYECLKYEINVCKSQFGNGQRIEVTEH